ncbi:MULTISPECIES: metalloregulator ArsR/SmtB family transcription factor [unclassified Bacillus (in: firmicutes)]|uniref:ArsR/SmtB family transcription factor n=1 Tax=unclassified Bacillus (in: firmicutes) TaxID=185979 RepID=UPI0008F0882F|nr:MULTISPECIES: metalloregulator ArsR/SmtB family transcription factor [unclassified Bacillus (in: firmicutes)]SFB21899.1 DNA-binding transcriptional regulator, ArsR family [Bacillus sp. UNCCL13]SFQ91053.1 DNA-binding transcriptional regulator, ArsR family [Bacillus sp. cl95]
MKEHDVCEISCVERDKVGRVQEQLSNKNTFEVAKLFKALADETRVKIAYALTLEEELCVCDVAHLVGASTATASHHLRSLKSLGLAKYRKEGKLVYYSLDDDHVKQLISIAFEHQEEVRNRDGEQ